MYLIIYLKDVEKLPLVDSWNSQAVSNNFAAYKLKLTQENIHVL